MKKKIVLYFLWFICAAIIIVGIGILPKRQLKSLKAEDILSATVSLMPPGDTIELNESEIADMVKLMNSLKTYGRGMEETEPLTGSVEQFIIEKTDGILEVNLLGNTYVYIDGKYYRAYYAPISKLAGFARGLGQ